MLAANCTGDFGKHSLAEHEILADLAQKCSVAVETLIAANPQITDKNVVFAGQPVCVPKACCSNGSVVCSSLDASPAASPSADSAGASECCIGGFGGGEGEA